MYNRSTYGLMIRLLAILFLFASLLGCKTTRNDKLIDDRVSVQNLIEKKYEEMTTGLSDGHIEFVENMYFKDATVYLDNGAVLEGIDAIKLMYTGMVRSGTVSMNTPTEVGVFDGVAYEIGFFSPLDDEGNPRNKLQYMILWKKEGKDWKIFREFVQGDG